MYTDDDLNTAVEEKIFSQDAVNQFRSHMSSLRQSPAVDEENFRLISGFNDVFVVIASGLLLFSIAWLGNDMDSPIGAICFAAAAWGLAEFFVLKRRMALPAIGLLLAFLGGVFAIPLYFSQTPSEATFVASGVLTTGAAWLHWQRFRVPITLAAGTAAALAMTLAVVNYFFPLDEKQVLQFGFIAGLATFAFAMYWDASDTERQTRRSDVAFWLHLLSAPLIVHPVFSSLGILQGVSSLSASLLVVALYIGLALVSIAVDRRAIMVSALIYVVFAFSSLMKTYGMVSYSFAITGICIGASLLLLSAFWHSSREKVLKLVPQAVQLHLPVVKV